MRCCGRSTFDEPVDWVGNAWGGHVGIVFAATWPERCRTLVTLGTPVQAYGRSERLLFRVLLAVYRVAGMVGLPLERDLSTRCCRPGRASNDPEAVALVLDCLRTMRRRALANAMALDLPGPPGPDPATRRDPLSHRVRHRLRPLGVDAEQAEEGSRLLAEGSVAVVPDTAYLIPLEAPEATIQLVRDVWAAQSSVSSPERHQSGLLAG